MSWCLFRFEKVGLTVDLRSCVSSCTKQQGITPAYPQGGCYGLQGENPVIKQCVVLFRCVCVCADSLSKGSGFYPVSVLCSHSVERAVKGTLFPHGADREPLQHTGEMERERPSVSAGVGWGVIELVEADGCGEGPSMCTSASHNISALAGPTI